jgi:hypothetical protein
MTLTGTVIKKQDATDGSLVLTATSNRSEVMLAPFQDASNIEYDMASQSYKPATEQELAAYKSLSSLVVEKPQGVQVQVTGRLHKQGATGYALDVRRFAIMGGGGS